MLPSHISSPLFPFLSIFKLCILEIYLTSETFLWLSSSSYHLMVTFFFSSIHPVLIVTCSLLLVFLCCCPALSLPITVQPQQTRRFISCTCKMNVSLCCFFTWQVFNCWTIKWLLLRSQCRKQNVIVTEVSAATCYWSLNKQPQWAVELWRWRSCRWLSFFLFFIFFLGLFFLHFVKTSKSSSSLTPLFIQPQFVADIGIILKKKYSLH